MKICIFGDSISAGQEVSVSWVDLLKKKYEILNDSVGGSTTFDVLDRFSIKNPDLIIFAVGLNDSKIVPGLGNQVPLKEFEENVVKLIKLSKKAKITFVGLTPADERYSITPIEAYTNKEIKKYEDKLKQMCKKHKITFVEVFDKWMKLDYKKLLADGLHPNEEGHGLLFEEISKSISNQK